MERAAEMHAPFKGQLRQSALHPKAPDAGLYVQRQSFQERIRHDRRHRRYGGHQRPQTELRLREAARDLYDPLDLRRVPRAAPHDLRFHRHPEDLRDAERYAIPCHEELKRRILRRIERDLPLHAQAPRPSPSVEPHHLDLVAPEEHVSPGEHERRLHVPQREGEISQMDQSVEVERVRSTPDGHIHLREPRQLLQRGELIQQGAQAQCVRSDRHDRPRPVHRTRERIPGEIPGHFQRIP